jgi:hypothetical protein
MWPRSTPSRGSRSTSPPKPSAESSTTRQGPASSRTARPGSGPWPTGCGLAPCQIVDYYHAAEQVHGLVDLLKPHLGRDADPETLTTELKAFLSAGRIQALAGRAHAIPLLDQSAKDKVATAVAYFTKNWSRMQYATFKREGLFIGSGAAESACKSLAENRAAMSGMRWTIAGADPIIALRALHRADHDNRYNHVFDRTVPRTPPSTTHQQQT